MIFHGVYLLHCVTEPDCIDAVVAFGVVLLAFKWLLRGVIFGVVLKHFSLFGRVPGDMQHACIFRTGRCIARMTCIAFLALASA